MGLIPVKISDISLSNLGFVVFLRSLDEDRTLPIFIGVPEAQAIAVQFNKLKTPRPLTHDLLKTILTLLNCRISKVVVNDLIENTFYAKIYLENDKQKYLIDSRPSDAIALALRFEIPIYVEEKVMIQSAIESSQEEGEPLDENKEEVEQDQETPPRKKTPLEELQDQLSLAVTEERYEDAAKLRDEIKRLQQDQN